MNKIKNIKLLFILLNLQNDLSVTVLSIKHHRFDVELLKHSYRHVSTKSCGILFCTLRKANCVLVCSVLCCILQQSLLSIKSVFCKH